VYSVVVCSDVVYSVVVCSDVVYSVVVCSDVVYNMVTENKRLLILEGSDGFFFFRI
jgi:hypothetical protein